MNETRPEKYREQARLYYQKMKADPVKWAAYKKRCGVNTRKWYQKIKHNFPRYEAMLEKQNERSRAYRARRPKKHLEMLARKRAARELDPFKARALKQRSYQKMRRDPVRYQRYLERCRAWYYEMKKNPDRHRNFLEGRKVYQRYRRIVKKSAAEEAYA